MPWQFRAPARRRSSKNLPTVARPARTRLGLMLLERRDVPSAMSVGAEFAISQSGGALIQPRIAMAPDGRYAVAWQGTDLDGAGVYTRLFDADGTPLTDEMAVNTTTAGDQTVPDIAMNALGDSAIVWQGPDGDGNGIFAQLFGADGTAMGPQIQVNATTANDQTEPAVAMAPDGRFVVSWTEFSAAGYNVLTRRFNADGTPLDDQDVSVNLDTTQASGSRVAANADRFVVAWTGEIPGTSLVGWGIVQAFGWDGSRQGAETRMPSTDELPADAFVAVGLAADGSFVATFAEWYDYAYDPYTYSVYAQRFDAAGDYVGQTVPVNTTTSGQQVGQGLAVAADGSFVAAWMSSGQDGSGYGVYGQRFDASGNKVDGEFQINTTTSGQQMWPALASDDNGNFTAVWPSAAAYGDPATIEAQQYVADIGTLNQVAPLVRLAAVDPTAAKWAVGNAHGASTGAFEVWRTGDMSQPLTVPYSLSPDSTAVAGTDYEALSGSVTIPAGQRSAGILVQPVDDAFQNNSETVAITIDPSFDYVGDGANATVTINESGVYQDTTVTGGDAVPTVGIAALDTDAAELPGGVTSTGLWVVYRVDSGDENVVIIGGGRGDSSVLHTDTAAVTVNYTVSQTGTPSNDYQGLSGAVDLPAGALAVPIVLTPVNDQTTEGSEAVTVTLSPGSGYFVSGPSSDVVTIRDDDWYNNAPVAYDDQFEVSWNGSPDLSNSLNITEPDFLNNDSDSDGDPIYIVAASRPSHAAELYWNFNGTLTYVPAEGFVGDATFTYIVSDGIAQSNATVTIHVVNQAPTANDDLYDVPQGGSLAITDSAIMNNDFDPDGDPITVQLATPGTRTQHGTIDSFNSDGTFQWTPDAGLSGTDSIPYNAFDGAQLSQMAYVVLNVEPADAAPAVEFVDSVNTLYSPATMALGVSNYVTTDDLPAPDATTFSMETGDPENFRIRVLDKASTAASLTVKLQVLHPTQGQGAQVTFENVYTLSYRNTTDPSWAGYYRSDFLRLVSDDVDDAVAGTQTIKVQLGDTVKLTYTPVNGAPATESIDVGRPPAEDNNGPDQRKHDIREVKVHIVDFAKMGGGGPVATQADIERDLQYANERLAQSNIRVVLTAAIDMGPGGQGVARSAGIANGVFNTRPSYNALGSFKDNDPNSIDVFYVEQINAGTPTRPANSLPAFSFVQSVFGVINPAWNNMIAIEVGPSDRPNDPFVLPHEMMHILLNRAHRDGTDGGPVEPSVGLFGVTPGQPNTVTARKRIGPNPQAAAARAGNDDTLKLRAKAETLP